MTKQIRFVSRRDEVPAEEFEARWHQALARLSEAAPQARPARVAACTVIHGLTGTDAPHDGIELAWFSDADHGGRFEEWRATLDVDVVDPRRTQLVVADELVVRGADWLERRWSDGGDKLKHMAIARRARGLTPQQFSERWRARAGQIRRPGAASATAIPDHVRGLAYVQNHPRPLASGEPAYDAVNEVYFDDLDGLRARIEWFRENLSDQAEDDLVSANWLLAVREVVPEPRSVAGCS